MSDLMAYVNVVSNTMTGTKTITAKNEISIYPNPATTAITINNLPLTNNDLLITDILGSEVYHHAIINQQSTIINISNLNNGVYFYQIKNDKETLNGKFVVEK
jgi:hypothetical protein